MKNDLISIIIPIYNSSKYLEECIYSILNQTVENIEIILVDDGSIDNSLDICMDLMKKDKRIKVFSQENKGVSSARNVGIDNSNGKYIMFVDSDDTVAEYWAQDLYEVVNNNESIVICGFSKNNYRNKKYMIEPVLLDDKEDLSKIEKKDFYILYKKNLINYVWNKIYVKDIIDKYEIRFINNFSLGEDLLFNFEYMKCLNGDIIVLNKSLYNHSLRNCESLDNKYYPDLFEIYNKLYSEMYKLFYIFKSDINAYNKEFYISYYNMLCRAFSNTFKYKNTLSFFQKFKINNEIISSNEFESCINNLGEEYFNKIHFKILKRKNYFLEYIYMKFRNLLMN